MPYRGPDVWVTWTLLIGGTALTAIAVLQAFWPRERDELPGSAFAAAFSLGTLYAVPVIEITPPQPYLSGAVFAALFAGFLFADRIRAPQAAPAAIVVLLATLVGAAVAPAFDRDAPWFDYRSLGDSVANRGTVGYTWDHQYGPLDWPRDGRELLRIRAKASSYWKTESLDTFDGRFWRRTQEIAPFETEGEQDGTEPQWRQTISVRVLGLRSEQFVTAGTANRVFDWSKRPVPAGGGTFETARGVLRRGASYKADVYTPRPTPGQLATAGTDYPAMARPWLHVQLPGAGSPDTPERAQGAAVEVEVPPFGSDQAALVDYRGSGISGTNGIELLRTSGLRRIEALAERLKARSDTPYEYLRAVRQRVSTGADYTERPGRHDRPLDAFLFDDRRGYCQHFSGAMALLLRLGGVPARVAVGFAPGSFDREHDEYVITDFDAHSWVEAYFPTIGWVTFDPTPAAAPPREQIADEQAALAVERGRGTQENGDRQSDPASAATSAPVTAGAGGRLLRIGIAVGLLVLGIVLALVLLRRRRARWIADTPDAEVAELERALRRSGRPAPPRATLADIARRLSADEDAARYVQQVAARRFGRGGPAPGHRERRALRRELGSGLGFTGRVRAWWALPPRPF